MNAHDFLFELGCEELPAKELPALARALQELTTQALEAAELSFESLETFATPRRLGLLIKNLAEKQADRTVSRQGPRYEQAFDANGAPKLSVLGFVKACNASLDDLEIKDTKKGKVVVCTFKQPGAKTVDILAELMEKVVKALPTSKTMRWGRGKHSFLRPVHWLVMLYGDTVVKATLFGKAAGRESRGHRFHSPEKFTLTKPSDYETLLEQHYVLANVEKRRRRIQTQALKVLPSPQHQVIMEDDLLQEVIGLVEWPVILIGEFDPRFLEVPKEVLISVMKTHQKCFPVTNATGKLEPYFIIISNIDSRDPKQVIKGNERVVNARLSDALFFYETDRKKTLESHLEALNTVVFQKGLGSLGDKIARLSLLSDHMAKQLEADEKLAKQAGELSKFDLMTDMVGEFPELQGTMGYYYALHYHTSKAVAEAIREQYLPRFSGDVIPHSLLGAIVALADKLDLLIGIFGINKQPSGDKDPFALRRAAVGIIRILIEKKLPLAIKELLKKSKTTYKTSLPNKKVINETHDFIMDRLKAYYAEKEIPFDIFEAVRTVNPPHLLDFDKRIQAVRVFKMLKEAESLSAANKRVSNILKKQSSPKVSPKIEVKLFQSDAERTLHRMIQQKEAIVSHLHEAQKYADELNALAALKEPIDMFFDQVMVMDKDPKLKNNRLALLRSLQHLFSQVADLSLLQ